jgi:truncated hemoglobin YjbI
MSFRRSRPQGDVLGRHMTISVHVTPGVDEASIARLVRTFHARAREDALIGPIFNSNVADWDHRTVLFVDLIRTCAR